MDDDKALKKTKKPDTKAEQSPDTHGPEKKRRKEKQREKPARDMGAMAINGPQEKLRARWGVWLLFVIVFAALLVPVVLSGLISFRDMPDMLPIAQTQIVEFDHYVSLWQNPQRNGLLGNSLQLSLLGYVGALAIGIAAGLFVPRIRGQTLRRIALCVLLLPLFVPPISWVVSMLPKLETNPGLARLCYVIMASFTGAGLIGFGGASFAIAWPGRGFWRGVGWAATLWAFLTLTPNLEATLLLGAHQGSAAIDTLDSFAFRLGIQQTASSASAAAYMVKALLQLLVGAVVCGGVYIVFVRNRKQPLDTVVREAAKSSFGMWLGSAGVVTLVGMIAFIPRLGLLSYIDTLLANLLMQVVSAFLAGALAFAMGWVLIRALRSCGRVWFTLCAGLLLALWQPMIGLLWVFRIIGLSNTPIPSVLMALMTPEGLMLALLCAQLSRADRMRGRPVWKLALVPAAYAVAHQWGSILAPLLFQGQQAYTPWSMLLYNQMQGGLGMDLWTFQLVLIPPLLFGGLIGFGGLKIE